MASDINGYVDLGLNSLGFFTIPDATTPPQVNKYEYHVNSSIGVNQAQIDNVANIMRSSIPTDEKKYTPLQAKKIKVISAASLGTVVGAILYTQSIVPMLAVAGIVGSVVFGIWAFAYYSSFYDLDSAKERESLSQKMHTWDFAKVADNFTTDQLIRYDLLKSQLSAFTDRQRAGIYANIRNLYLDKKLLDNTQNQSVNTVNKTYEAGTKAIKDWINSCRIRSMHIEWNKIGRPQPQNTDNLNAKAIEAANNLVLITLENKYNQMMSPWSVWKGREEANIKEAYDNAMTYLNTNYVRCLQGAGTVNASGKIDDKAAYTIPVTGIRVTQQPATV